MCLELKLNFQHDFRSVTFSSYFWGSLKTLRYNGSSNTRIRVPRALNSTFWQNRDPFCWFRCLKSKNRIKRDVFHLGFFNPRLSSSNSNYMEITSSLTRTYLWTLVLEKIISISGNFIVMWLYSNVTVINVTIYKLYIL